MSRAETVVTSAELAGFERGILLASGSPRRRELLTQMALPFRVGPVPVDERVLASELPGDYVLRLALAKCAAAAERIGDWLAGGIDRVVLAADTTVVIDDEILGKPEDDAAAAATLRALSGRTHEVMTAIALCSGERTLSDLTVVQVRFSALTDPAIEAYLATGEGRDKAGSYGIQGIGGIFVEEIHGSYSAVVGLPVAGVETLLKRLDIDPWRLRSYG